MEMMNALPSTLTFSTSQPTLLTTFGGGNSEKLLILVDDNHISARCE